MSATLPSSARSYAQVNCLCRDRSCQPSETPTYPTEPLTQGAEQAKARAWWPRRANSIGTPRCSPSQRGVARSPVPQMRRQERVEMIGVQAPLKRREPTDLEDCVLVGMGEDRLLDPISPLPAGVDQSIEGNALDRVLDPVLGVHLLVREELLPVGDDQAEVAGTRPVDAGVEDLGEDATAQGEPDQARGIGGRAKGRADPVLGARRPARLDAGLARRRPGLGRRPRKGGPTPYDRPLSFATAGGRSPPADSLLPRLAASSPSVDHLPAPC